jgi:hypothetical protein
MMLTAKVRGMRAVRVSAVSANVSLGGASTHAAGCRLCRLLLQRFSDVLRSIMLSDISWMFTVDMSRYAGDDGEDEGWQRQRHGC